jgi:signal transduction histidine kinase
MMEVQTAVQGMTDLLESLLLFTQTGRALHPEVESIALVLQRAVAMARSHPAARDVKITIKSLSSIEAWIDSRKLGRAVFNLLLNACQAAKRGNATPAVTLTLHEDQQSIRIRIADNGPGVPAPLRQKIFLPFVSEGRESGIGLGLTLAQQIAQEHGGNVTLDQMSEAETIFTINLPKSSLQALGDAVERKTSPAYAPANGEG